jgi:hypothetical protein
MALPGPEGKIALGPEGFPYKIDKLGIQVNTQGIWKSVTKSGQQTSLSWKDGNSERRVTIALEQDKDKNWRATPVTALVGAVGTTRIAILDWNFNAAYNDDHTCIPPWNRVDYDDRIPGAGGCGVGVRLDQRGVPRPSSSGLCDIGAFEDNFGVFLPLVLRGSPEWWRGGGRSVIARAPFPFAFAQGQDELRARSNLLDTPEIASPPGACPEWSEGGGSQ